MCMYAYMYAHEFIILVSELVLENSMCIIMHIHFFTFSI